MSKNLVPYLFTLFTKSLLAALFILYSGTVSTANSMSESADKFSLFGIAMHKKLRNKLYIGAILAPTEVTKLDELQNPDTPKRMSLRFVKNYSRRAFARMWEQGIALNNSKESCLEMKEDVGKFISIFKRQFIVGDELRFDFDPLIGTKIYLNETLFLTIIKLDFFQLILNVWLGKISPTQEFKAGISGKSSTSVKKQLYTKYLNYSSVLGRFDGDKSALDNKDLPAEEFKRKASAKLNSSILVKHVAKSKTKIVKKTKYKKPTKKTPLKSKVSPLVKTVISSKKPIASIEKKETQKNKVSSIYKNAFSSKTDVIKHFYTKKLIDRTISFQTYPIKALMNRMEGDALVKVLINSEGEIISSSLIEKTRHKVLNKTIFDILKRSSPFPSIPKKLSLEIFEFEVPISFVLNKPKKPNR